MSDAVVISHSEVESFLSCQQKHHYAFVDSTYGPLVGLEPKRFSDSLFRGISGHEALSVFFQAVKDGSTIDEAAEKSYDALRAIITRPEVITNGKHVAILTDLIGRILPRFYANEVVALLKQGWKPVHVEETFRLRMEFDDGEVFVYPFRPDVIMSDRAGNLWVWDHKFVYNFYSSSEISLLPQIPKYIGALRALGFYIKGGYYNMLRWREVKDESAHVAHEKLVPTDERVKNAFQQQYNVMVEIARRKLAASRGEDVPTTRVLSSMVCKSCSFKPLCIAELNGENTTLMKKIEFRPNSYGYSEEA